MEYVYNKTNINSDKLTEEIKNSILLEPLYINIDFSTKIKFENPLTEEQLNQLNQIVENHTPISTKEIIKQNIENAINFGKKITIEFATENVLMGITQSGKTKLVADTLKDVAYYLSNGSLYEAIKAIDEVQITPEMAPFITQERLSFFKNKIQQYLGI